MTRVELDRIGQHELATWRERLASEPLLSDAASRRPPALAIFCTAAAAAVAAIAWLVDPILDPEQTSTFTISIVTLSLAYGVAATLLTFTLLTLLRDATVARAPFPCGRFLYRWGYVEIEPWALWVVYGRDLAVEVSTRSRRDALPETLVHLRAGAWSTTFRILADGDSDGLAQALRDLSPAPLEHHGYRSGPAPRRSHPRPARSLYRPRSVAVASGVTAALVAYATVVPAQAIASATAHPHDARRWWAIRETYPDGSWPARRAEAALAERWDEIAPALGGSGLFSLHALLIQDWHSDLDPSRRPTAYFDDRCTVSAEDATAIDDYVASRVGPVRARRIEDVTLSPTTSFRRQLRAILRPDYVRWSESELEPDAIGWTVECRFEPIGLVEEGDHARAAIRTHVSIELDGHWTDELELTESPRSGALPGSTTNARYDGWAESTSRRIAEFLWEVEFDRDPREPPPRDATLAPP